MNRFRTFAVPIALLGVGAAFLCIGIAFGQPNGVLQKAIRICLECIGLG